jgi:hypothetical protein
MTTSSDPARAVHAGRILQRIGFGFVAVGALVVIGADYFLGATKFFTAPRVVGFTLVVMGVMVQLWAWIVRRAAARAEG